MKYPHGRRRADPACDRQHFPGKAAYHGKNGREQRDTENDTVENCNGHIDLLRTVCRAARPPDAPGDAAPLIFLLHGLDRVRSKNHVSARPRADFSQILYRHATGVRTIVRGKLCILPEPAVQARFLNRQCPPVSGPPSSRQCAPPDPAGFLSPPSSCLTPWVGRRRRTAGRPVKSRAFRLL